jgi:zinc and cadmium transporter
VTLLSIILATLAGGVLSVLAAGLLSLTVLARLAPKLVSFAVGILLAAALLELVPEAAQSMPVEKVGATVVAGLAAFFLLEKFALWRHDHGGHGHPTVAAVVLGDGLHNFVDGLLVAAAFLQDPALGLATAAAVIAHEIPQEIGDFMVLLACGVSRARALLLNVLSGAAMVAGGVLGYFAFRGLDAAIPIMLALAAASFLYIAIADLVPILQRDRRPWDFPVQFALLAGGASVVVLGHG